MKILLTGGSGLVGRFVADELMTSHAVTNLDIKPPHRAEIPWQRFDLLMPDGLDEVVRGFDAVVHLAGIPHPLDHPAEVVYRINALGTYHLLESCVRRDVRRFVFLSSESTLGFAFSTVRQWPLFVPIDESHPLRPQDPYGLSKVTGELLCRGVVARSSMTAICLRPPWIWVPEEREKAMYRSLIRDYPRWSKNLWAYIHVRDVAQAIQLALTAEPPERFAACFISAAENWTGEDSVGLLKRFYPETADVRRGFGGADSFLSHRLAEDILGYHPRFTRKDIFPDE